MDLLLRWCAAESIMTTCKFREAKVHEFFLIRPFHSHTNVGNKKQKQTKAFK
jgi:hypothetical protein